MSRPPGGGAPQPEVAARCYRHPNREALVRCTRCERPICPDCMRPASVGFHCPDDVQQGARTVRAPRNAVGAKIMQAPPYVTGTLVALNVLAYLATGLQQPGTLTDPTRSQLFRDGQLYPKGIHDDGRYYELLTSAFLHLTPLHIIANMIALALVGPALEQLLGWWRYAAVYLLSAVGGGAAVYAFGDAITVTAGASGAIFGVFGACLVLVRKVGLDAQWLVGIVVINFVVTFAVPGISQLGHIGGFVAGLLCGAAVGGLPQARTRVPTRVQAYSLGGIGLLVVLVVLGRTLTW